MDKCICGAKRLTPNTFECGSLMWSSGRINRVPKCYETEITALKSQLDEMTRMRNEAWEDKHELKKLVREMGEVLRPLCEGFWPGEDPHKAIDKGTEILNRPKVREIMEE